MKKIIPLLSCLLLVSCLAFAKDYCYDKDSHPVECSVSVGELKVYSYVEMTPVHMYSNREFKSPESFTEAEPAILSIFDPIIVSSEFQVIDDPGVTVYSHRFNYWVEHGDFKNLQAERWYTGNWYRGYIYSTRIAIPEDTYQRILGNDCRSGYRTPRSSTKEPIRIS